MGFIPIPRKKGKEKRMKERKARKRKKGGRGEGERKKSQSLYQLPPKCFFNTVCSPSPQEREAWVKASMGFIETLSKVLF